MLIVLSVCRLAFADPESTAMPVSILSSYSSALTLSSSVYSRGHASGRFYYEAIRINTSITGSYLLKTNSTIGTIAYLYTSCFNPNNSTANLLVQGNDSMDDAQTRIYTTLHTSTAYVLVVTTIGTNVTGAFSISASGSDKIIFTRYRANETDLSLCQPPQSFSTTTITSTSTTTPFVTTGKSSAFYFYEGSLNRFLLTILASKSGKMEMVLLFLLIQIASVFVAHHLFL